MKVILLKDVRGVGQRHEVRNVADGHAINYLFPQKLAEPATEAKIRELEAQKAAHEAELQKQEEALGKSVQQLNGKKVTLHVRATEKGGLFKAVTSKDVARAILAEHGIEIPESAIQFSAHIKTVGEHAVALASKSHKAELTVAVAAI